MIQVKFNQMSISIWQKIQPWVNAKLSNLLLGIKMVNCVSLKALIYSVVAFLVYRERLNWQTGIARKAIFERREIHETKDSVINNKTNWKYSETGGVSTGDETPPWVFDIYS